MPRSLKVVIGLLLVFGLGALLDVLTALGTGAIKVTSGLMFLGSAWGLSRASRFWRTVTMLWLGALTLLGAGLLVLGLAMVFTPPSTPDAKSFASWLFALAAVCSLVVNIWMIRVLDSDPVQRWFAAARAEVSPASA